MTGAIHPQNAQIFPDCFGRQTEDEAMHPQIAQIFAD